LLADCDGSYVNLDFYELVDGNWVHRLTTTGRCGVNGTTADKTDGDLCTPEGEFALTFCCGISKPTTSLDFQWIDADSVWVDDADSVYYNTIQSSSIKGEWDSAEPLYNDYFSNKLYNYCVNIAVNGDGLTRGEAIPGKGSFITLCGKTTTLTETEGCIDIPAEQMLNLLPYLDSNKNPEIIIY
jgi:L,D-peptidoglycan transpeptidase YkuD (ErfK/YbiS/YcfS/YnhG family)